MNKRNWITLAVLLGGGALCMSGCDASTTPRGGPGDGVEHPGAQVAQQPPTATDSSPSQEPIILAFDNKGADTKWATAEESAWTVAFSNIPNTKLTDVRCKATVCRLVFGHEDETALIKFGNHFRRTVSNRLKSTTHLTQGDFVGLRTIVFITREGYAEPDVDGTPRLATPNVE